MNKTTAKKSIWQSLRKPKNKTGRRWLKWHPTELDDCTGARAKALPDPLTESEIDELKSFHRKIGANEATLDAVDMLAEPNCRVVIAGQQPGILAGPLYSIYKALCSIHLARELGKRHPNLKFVPVFWIGSEDHDFDEVRRAYWPGPESELEEILMDRKVWTAGQMIGTMEAGHLAKSLIDRIVGSTYRTEFRQNLLDDLENIYGPETNWEEAFAKLLLRLMGQTPLVLVSPLMAWVRRRSIPIFSAEALGAGKSSARIIDAGEQLKEEGLSRAIHRRPDSINLFWIDEKNRRHTLRWADDKVFASLAHSAAGEQGDPNELARNAKELDEMIRDRPQSFSANVVTRPLVQDSILPTVAQVVGPGEASYLAQVESVYESFKVFRPVRYPRPEVILIPNNVERLLKKMKIDLNDALNMNSTELSRLVLERDLNTSVLKGLNDLRKRQTEEIHQLRNDLPKNHSIDSAIDKLCKGLDRGYDTIQDRILYSRQEDERNLKMSTKRIENSLHPVGQPQERVLNPVVPFVVNYGFDWIDQLARMIDYDSAIGLQSIAMSKISSAKA